MTPKPLPAGWKIIVPDAELSDSQVTYEPGGITAMVPYRIPLAGTDGIAYAPAFFLGFSNVTLNDVTAKNVLTRTLPQPHPLWDGLWATRVSIRGEVSTQSSNFRGDVTPADNWPYDAYYEYRAEVFYTARKYPILEDNDPSLIDPLLDVVTEHKRWTNKLPSKPYYELIAIDGTQLAFEDDPKVVAPGPITIRKTREKFRWEWYDVPLDWLFDQNGRSPHITSRLNQININVWEGYEKGSVRLEAVDIDYDFAPAALLDLGIAPGYPPRYAKVVFDFVHDTAGWNYIPFPGTGEYKRVAYKNTLPPNPGPPKYLFDETDFNAMFAEVPPAGP